MTQIKVKANSLWGGHFNYGPAEVMQRINESISFDQKLYRYDIKSSIAHCKMLAKTGIILEEEKDKIVDGLKQIEKEISSGKFKFQVELEDIHMNIESRLHDIIGDVAGKLHTARSRNDQVATDFKLFVKDSLQNIDVLVKENQKSLISKAEEYYDYLIPGYTHLQVAQPVTFGHHLMAYVEMLGRDRSRIASCLERIDECPLGAAALAGTSFKIDREFTAKELGFSKPTINSIDSVSDRDFAMELLSVTSIIATHLSRLAEEIVLWMSAEFDFIDLSDSYTTGSSIMPQKRNPDAAELVRGKTGRIYGNLVNMLTVMKGLPLTYSKDMQEDKEPVFDTVENIYLSLNAMSGMISDITANKENMQLAASRGYSTATDLADWLVQNVDIPFRKAHHVTGKIVKYAEDKECDLADVPLEFMQSINPDINENIFDVLCTRSSIRSRKSFGGTAPENVLESINIAKKKYDI